MWRVNSLVEEQLASLEKLCPPESLIYVHILRIGYGTLPVNAILSQLSVIFLYTTGSQSVLCESQGIREQFPGDLCIYLRNGYFEGYLLLKLKA
jgi:hypothetical protein